MKNVSRNHHPKQTGTQNKSQGPLLIILTFTVNIGRSQKRRKALMCNEFSLRITRSRVYVASYTKTVYMTALSYISGHNIHHFTCYLNSAY